MKSSNIGGQAVLEGIMMKHREEYSVAVRKPDGQIEVTKDRYTGVAGRVGVQGRRKRRRSARKNGSCAVS